MHENNSSTNGNGLPGRISRAASELDQMEAKGVIARMDRDLAKIALSMWRDARKHQCSWLDDLERTTANARAKLAEYDQKVAAANADLMAATAACIAADVYDTDEVPDREAGKLLDDVVDREIGEAGHE